MFNACVTIKTNLPHHNESEVGESYSLINKRNSESLYICFTSLCNNKSTKEFSSLMNNKFRGKILIYSPPWLTEGNMPPAQTTKKLWH